MAQQNQAFILLFSIFYLCSLGLTAATITTAPTLKEALHFIQSSCKTTTYQSLCVDTLSIYANTIQTNPGYLVKTAIAVSLNQARYVKLFASNLLRNSNFRTLADCQPTTDTFTTDLNLTVQELELCNGSPDCLSRLENAERATIAAESYMVENSCSNQFSGPVEMTIRGRISGAVKKSLLAKLVKLEHEINNAKLLFIALK